MVHMSKESDDLSFRHAVFGSIIGAAISAATFALAAFFLGNWPVVIGGSIMGALFLPGMVLLSKVIDE